MKKLDTTPRHLRKFSLQMAAAFAVVGTFFLLRHKTIFPVFYSLGTLFLIGCAVPVFGKGLYLFWMRLTYAAEWLVTRLIMAAVFYLVMTPLGLVIKLSGRDLLDRKSEPEKDSYWKKTPQGGLDPKGYERQF